MKPAKFDYVAPTTLSEALTILAENPDDVQIIAGGQSLAPMLNLRMASPAALLDINCIPALSGMEVLPGGTLRLGALTRHREVERSALIGERQPLLHAVMPHVAHVAVRNRGTIGGSLCLSDPSAEWPALCLACDAEIGLESLRGRRVVKARDFGLGLYFTAREPDEILTDVTFPAWPAGRRFGFEEVSRRAGDFAIVGMMSLVDRAADGTVADARIVAFGATESACLLDGVAGRMQGTRPSAREVEALSQIADAGLELTSDPHASADYRRRLVRALTRRTLLSALALEPLQEAS